MRRNLMEMLAIISLSALFFMSVSAQGGDQKPTNVTGIVYDAANFGCNQINAESNSEDWFTLLFAGNATVQIVSGEIFRMDLTMGDSSCMNIPLNQNATTDECPLRENAMIMKYHSTVLFQHWADPVFTFLGFQPEYSTV